jgi:hypothetical protein
MRASSRRIRAAAHPTLLRDIEAGDYCASRAA